jgi:Mrp family chromosome partitioning ATPase
MGYLSRIGRRTNRPGRGALQMEDVLPRLASQGAGRQGSRTVIASVGLIAGAQEIAANFILRLAEAGYQTLAVDANLNRPALHHYFMVNNERGLGSLLGSSEAPHRYLQPSSVQNVTVLAAEPSAADRLSLLGTEDLFHRVSLVADRFDCVVADCTCLPAALVATVAAGADQILLLAEQNVTPLRQMTDYLDLLRSKNTVEPSLILVHG